MSMEAVQAAPEFNHTLVDPMTPPKGKADGVRYEVCPLFDTAGDADEVAKRRAEATLEPSDSEWCLYAHNVPPNATVHQMIEVLQGMSRAEERDGQHEQRLSPLSRLTTKPRHVYLMCCGQLKSSYHLRLRKQSDDNAIFWEAHLKDGATRKNVLSIMGANEELCIEFARKALKDAFAQGGADSPPSDEHFEVYQKSSLDLRVELYETLVHFLRHAQQQNAVLVVPFWQCNGYNSGHDLLLKALDHVGWRGSLVNVSIQRWTLVSADEQLLEKRAQYAEPNSGPRGKPFRTEPVMRRATHTIMVHTPNPILENSASNTRVAALTARLLAGGRVDVKGALECRRDNRHLSHTLCTVVFSGGRGTLYNIGAAAEEKIPLLCLKGSGKLADFLPKAWLRRTDAGFDITDETRSVSRACGFGSEIKEDEGTLIRSAIFSRIVVHPLSAGPHVLVRVLRREFGDSEKVLDDAKRRRLRYAREAAHVRAPAKQIHFIYLCGAFLITVLATLHSQLAERRSELREEPSAAAEDFDRPLDVLKYVLAVLPILLSVVLNLRKELDLEQKADAFAYAATLMESAMWQYCMRVGGYSNAALSVHEDVPTARAERLASELEAVNATVMTVTQSPPISTPKPTIPWLCRRRRARVAATADLTDCDDDGDTSGGGGGERLGLLPWEPLHTLPHMSRLQKHDGSGYMEYRVRPNAELWQRTARRLGNRLFLQKALTYLIGAGASALALFKFEKWLCVTTALVTAIAAWDARAPVEERLRAAQRAVQGLANADSRWNFMPEEKKFVQQELDRLVAKVETIVVEAQLKPPEWPRDEQHIMQNSKCPPCNCAEDHG